MDVAAALPRGPDGQAAARPATRRGARRPRRRKAYEPAADGPGCLRRADYFSPELETSYRLVVKGGMLVAEHSRHEDSALSPVRKDRFEGRFLESIQFDRDENGRVNGFHASSGRVRNLRFDRRD